VQAGTGPLDRENTQMKTLAKAPLAALQVICSLPAPTYGQAGEDPLSPQGLSAQDPRFQHLTTEDGLSDSRVWGVTHDRWGFMWFATFDGLSRYDGYEFKVYRRDPYDPNSPPATQFKLIYEDSAGVLWSATWGEGLVRYDPETERFVHYQHVPTDSNNVSSSRVRSLYEDSSGTLWIGTQTNGLNRLDRENWALCPLPA
jgi:ligand-binding sensor domain-containing protein